MTGHHPDPFGFTEFASLSPLFAPTPLDPVSESPAESYEDEGGRQHDYHYSYSHHDELDDDEESASDSALSEGEEELEEDEEGSGSEFESETNPSRTPSPSPPSTPPLSTATSESHHHPIIPNNNNKDNTTLPKREETPEEQAARLRAEKHAKQQEEFHRRAEEIRRRHEEKRREKEAAATAAEQPAWVDPTDTPFYQFSVSSSCASDEETRYPSSYPGSTSTASGSSTASTSTSTASSSCSSPLLQQQHPPLASPLEPFVIAPKSEEDLIRLLIFHEQQWERIASFNSLQWSDFPWPVLNFIGPRSARELTLEEVTEYILSAFDWQTREERRRSKERLREHVRRWHMDRFESRYLRRVPSEKGERERVRKGAELVVRHLTELLGRFNELEE